MDMSAFQSLSVEVAVVRDAGNSFNAMADKGIFNWIDFCIWLFGIADNILVILRL